MVDFTAFDDRIVVDYLNPPDDPIREITRQTVAFVGRLADGARADYAFTLGPREMNWNEDPHSDLGALPFIGRSERNRPIILTDRGPMEIVTPDIDHLAMPAITVVRQKDMSIVARYFPTSEGLFIITRTGEVGAWETRRRVCVTPPRNVPGVLAIVTKACRAAGFQRSGEDPQDPGGNVVRSPEIEPPPALIERVYKNDRYPGAAPYFVESAPGTPFILITSDWDEDCC